jgi:hypothetical protein
VTSFDRLAAAAFALDSGVRWVAVARPGEPPRSRYRANVVPMNASASDEAEERIANPAILALAQGRGDWDLNGLRYVIVAYGKLTQVIAPLPEGGHISLSLDRGVDAGDVGDGLIAALTRGDEALPPWTASVPRSNFAAAAQRG